MDMLLNTSITFSRCIPLAIVKISLLDQITLTVFLAWRDNHLLQPQVDIDVEVHIIPGFYKMQSKGGEEKIFQVFHFMILDPVLG